MKHFSKFLMIGVIVALMSVLVLPAVAQDGAPGEGGVMVTDNTGGDPSTFNPILGSDTVSSDVYGWMYPGLVGIDPATLNVAPNVAGNAAESWEFDETGTILTVNLRQDITWSDGTPVTADDFLWSFNAVQSGESSSPRTYALTQLADGTEAGGTIHSATKIDDYTIEFEVGTPTFEDGELVSLEPNCNVFTDMTQITMVPAHIYEAAFGSDYAAMDDVPFFVPEGTYGTFTDPFFEAGVQVSLLANQAYPDTQLGYVSPSEWVMLSVPDSNVSYERFLAGEITYTGIPSQFQNEFRSTVQAEGGFQIFESAQNGYTYMGYNTADPENPVDGLGEDGEPQDQGLHPIFGDVMVRQALAYAVDVPSMIGTQPDGDTPATGILEGNGFQAFTHNSPISWVQNENLAPYPFEPETALAMLEEAGWSDADGNGVLECNGCLYATEVDPSYEGTEFVFTLQTNAGNIIRERVGQTIREQLGEIGVTVEFEAIDFGTLVDVLLGQQFDAIIIGWSLGLPFDPDGRWAFSAQSDIVGSGFAMTSYNNPELNDLWDQATKLPGCDPEERRALYEQAMEILYNDQPYMFLFHSNVMAAAQDNIENFDPYPVFTTWNIDAWREIQN
jgi:peptide/nickel transport system substrate-binding protein